VSSGGGNRGHARLLVLLVGGFLALVAALLGLTADAKAAIPNPNPALISRWDPCEPMTGVTVVVDFQALGGHEIQVGCALGEQVNGVGALVHAGFTVDGTLQYGLNFICKIDNQPTPEEQSCNHTPPESAYWEYFHGRPGGQWEYSGSGAGEYVPRLGSVEGWGFARKLDPHSKVMRIAPQDGGGGALQEPAIYPSSAIQLRLAQEWIARRLAAATPSPSILSTNEIGELVAEAAGLGRTGYPLTGPRFAKVREFLATPATAAFGTTWAGDPSEPRLDRLGPYAIALAALEGGDPLLSDHTNLRRWLTEDIEPTTGKVRGTSGWEENGIEGGAVLEALARTGSLPTRATALAEMIERTQKPGGEFGTGLSQNVAPMLGLRAAQEAGMGGLGASISKLATWVVGLQEGDGRIRQTSSAEPGSDPTSFSTAEGALILGRAGEESAAVAAAQSLSPFQISTELAGDGPAASDVGAFASGLEALSQAINYGPEYTVIEEQTPRAVEALAAAPWLNPVSATVTGGLALGVGTEGALVVGSVETGTADQTVSVEYGPTEAYGSSAAGPHLLAEFGPTAVEVELSRLQPSTGYHFRLVATGPFGEKALGADRTLTTRSGPLSSGTSAKASPGSGSGPSVPSVFASVKSSGGAAPRKGRTAQIAKLSCQVGAVCTLATPVRVSLRIVGKVYWAMVLAPGSLAGGASASVLVRLSKAALAALAGHTVTIVVPVTLSAAGGTRTVRAKAKVVGAQVRSGRGA
jgi:hypothetical protein